jgi:hypothetical protein
VHGEALGVEVEDACGRRLEEEGGFAPEALLLEVDGEGQPEAVRSRLVGVDVGVRIEAGHGARVLRRGSRA